ncbi:type II secretion system protein N [Mariprofundus sp. EBB-1]|uniref:type II secretion system protein N n=1 Tax=Mariprofundus sp. EBB-1 TaxID=2650971 RepID=UPI001F16026A|nr:type II secretion system protein N [Mariprofundus sp. EBB-1]
MWIEAGLVVLLAYLLFNWMFPADDIVTPIEPLDQSMHSSEALPDLAELVAVPLFGKVPPHVPKAAPVQQQVAVAIIKPLTFRLLGTVVAGEASSVILSLSEGSEQQVFTVGDFIQPGVKLYYVDANAMVVERAGKLERIIMEYSERLHANVTGEANTTADLSTLMTQAKLVLHHDGDKADGFVITGIVVNSIYHKSGLYNGDLIRNINGIELVKANQIDVLYNGMRNASTIELELIRSGKLKRLSYTAP